MPAAATAPLRVLILGGGFAGLACARGLAGDPRFAVTLVDRTNHHLFQPLLYQVATAALAAPDIARTLRDLLERAGNVSVVMEEIASLDVPARSATGSSGRRYEWDRLVLAVGARTSFFGHAGWEHHSLGLKTLADAQRVRHTILANLERAERIEDPAARMKLMTVAIVGGGATGVELAGAFADLLHRTMKGEFRHIDTSQLRIVLIEGSERILEAYDPDQSEYARQRLTRLGVDVWTGKRVSEITEQRLRFTDDSALDSGAIIWAAGVEAQPLTRHLGLEPADRAGRLTPLPDLSLPGLPEVFVAGDLVRMKDAAGKPVPGVAPAAVQMGRHIARVLKEKPGQAAAGRPAFRYRDKGLMAIIGRNSAVVKSGPFRMRGFLAWATWLFIHILFLIGFRNKVAVLLGWAFAYLRDNPGARIIVHPPVDPPPP